MCLIVYPFLLVLDCDNLSNIEYGEACDLCHSYHLYKDGEHRGLFWSGSQCLGEIIVWFPIKHNPL